MKLEDEHKIIKGECNDCWKGYPVKCECGGMIHSEFLDTDIDDNITLITECDKCGENE